MSFSPDLTTSFRALSKLNNVKFNSYPALYRGELSDPTSWIQWLNPCFLDKDQKRVNAHLNGVIENISSAIFPETELSGEQCSILKDSISKLTELFEKATENTIGCIKDDVHWKLIGVTVALKFMRSSLKGTAEDNTSYIDYTKTE